MTIVRLYADETGESHFENLNIKTTEVDFAPPAPKIFISTPTKAERHLFLQIPKGWYGEPHPAPNRQLMIVLRGSLEVIASDGTTHLFRTGDTCVVEDTQGKGHATRNVGEGMVSLSVTQY